jgi:hypothetical protein
VNETRKGRINLPEHCLIYMKLFMGRRPLKRGRLMVVHCCPLFSFVVDEPTHGAHAYSTMVVPSFAFFSPTMASSQPNDKKRKVDESSSKRLFERPRTCTVRYSFLSLPSHMFSLNQKQRYSHHQCPIITVLLLFFFLCSV